MNEDSKLTLAFNPYTYTRVQVMRTMLLKKPDYDRLLKMDPNEIADYLSKSTYRKEIDKLGLTYEGADLVEHALSLNLTNTMSKIKRIADPDLKQAFITYMLREDFHTTKVILRALFTGVELSEAETVSLTSGVGVLKKNRVEHMRNAKTAYEIMQRSGIIDLHDFKDLKGKSDFNLGEIENRMDRQYFSKVLSFTERLTEQGSLFAEFLKNEIDLMNILTATKLIRLGKPKEEVKRHLIMSGYHLNRRRLDRLASSRSLEDISHVLSRTPYKEVVDMFIKEEKPLLFFKTLLYRKLLKRSLKLMHIFPLSVNTIIGYALLKEVEVKNLKVLIKGKQLGVSNEQIEEALVI